MNDIRESQGANLHLELADRYSDLMALRSEAFEKYKARELDTIKGPPIKLTLPTVAIRSRPGAKKKIGPFSFYDKAPILRFVEAAIGARERLRILEIGPGGGELALNLTERFSNKIEAYYGFDRDASVCGAFTRIESIEDLDGGIDVVIASEVIEHMSANQLFTNILTPLLPKLNPGATFVLSTPNPTAPGGIARDFTHVQNYPWYDLYAIFRLVFERVDIYRSFYAYTAAKLLLLVPRIALCSILEMEWCDGLACVASIPRAGEAQRSV